jgi:hypothetical protein
MFVSLDEVAYRHRQLDVLGSRKWIDCQSVFEASHQDSDAESESSPESSFTRSSVGRGSVVQCLRATHVISLSMVNFTEAGVRN